MNNLNRFVIFGASFFIMLIIIFSLTGDINDALDYATAMSILWLMASFFVYKTNDEKYRETTKRVCLAVVTRADAEEYLNDGWVIAIPEEIENDEFDTVILEKRIGI